MRRLLIAALLGLLWVASAHAQFVPMPGMPSIPVVAGGCSTANFAQDSFTGGAGTPLTTHTDNLGNSWTRLDSTSTVVQLGGDGTIHTNEMNNNSVDKNSGTPPCADYQVSANIHRGVNTSIFLLCRIVDLNNYYMGGYEGFGNTWSIYRVVSGSFILVGTAASSNSTSTTALATFSCVGTTLTLTISGGDTASSSGSATDFASAGNAGILVKQSAAAMDSFVAHH